MKSLCSIILTLFLPISVFASDFNKDETACGFGDLNANYAKAYAESYADTECKGLPANRISEWKLTDYVESETGTKCTKAEATFSCTP